MKFKQKYHKTSKHNLICQTKELTPWPNAMNDWDDDDDDDDELNALNDWCIVYQMYSKNFDKTKQNSK